MLSVVVRTPKVNILFLTQQVSMEGPSKDVC
jgi:hypothetical protein